MDKIIGYFVWEKDMKGGAYPAKFHSDRNVSIDPGRAQHYQIITVAKYPLNEEEWLLSLDALANKYPCPSIG